MFRIVFSAVSMRVNPRLAGASLAFLLMGLTFAGPAQALARENNQSGQSVTERQASLLRYQITQLCGDMNGNDAVDVLDVITLLQVIVGSIEPDDDQQVVGDMDQDGVVNLFDAITLLRVIVGATGLQCQEPLGAEIFVEMEAGTLVNDSPAGTPFTVVTVPATPNIAIPLRVFRTSGTSGATLPATQTFNSVNILQNGVVNNELVTNEDGVAQGELVPGPGGQGTVELFFGTETPIKIELTNPPKDCDCPEESSSTTENPHSGEVSVTETDLSIPIRSNFKIDRTYNSQSAHRRGIAKGDVGVDWAYTFISDFLVADGGNVIAFRDTNRTDVFTATSDPEVFIAPIEYYEELRRNSTGEFELRSADGTLKVYAGFNDPVIPGRLIHQEDRNGNFMSFLYEGLAGSNRYVLTTAVDTMGRNVQFRYYPVNDPNGGRRGRLWEIEDFRRDNSVSGRIVSYDYDALGNLISVRSPIVSGTPNGNDFPVGKTTRYHYLTKLTIPPGVTGYARERLQHNLTAIEYPNETSTDLDPSNPQNLNTTLATYRESFVYGTDPGNASTFDRVVKHTIGGTNANGVPAGGSITHDYRVVGPNATGANDPYMVTTRTDRRGNVTEYTSGPGGTQTQKKELTRGFRNVEPAAFVTRSEYNEDKERLVVTLPEGNSITYTFDSKSSDRFQQGNLIATVQTPGPRGGDQATLSTESYYEPLYQQLSSFIDPRGLDPAFNSSIPDTCGRSQRDRYTTRYFFDYQEGNPAQVLSLLATELSISEAEVQVRLNNAGVQLGLGDLNKDGDVSARIGGNIVRTVDTSVALLAGSNQAGIEGDTCQEIVTLQRHNKFGQKTSIVDPENNQHQWSYFPERDPDGDGTLTPSPADGRLQDASTGGYVRNLLRDSVAFPTRNNSTNPAPTLILESYTYDDVGNRTSLTNGRGIRTDYVVNELNQVVEVSRASAVPPTGGSEPVQLTAYAYKEHISYDFNNNVVLRQIEDRGNTSNTAGFVDYTYRYDILNDVIEKTEEVSVSERLVHRNRYDANQNLTLSITPEGNARTYLYDERNLRFETTLGAQSPTVETLGAPAGLYNPRGGVPATTTYNYDANRNMVERVDAADTDSSISNNSVTSGAGDATLYGYDGFDRRVSTIDPLGDQTLLSYDPAGNMVREKSRGLVGGPSPTDSGGAGNVDLSDFESRFDELNRRVQIDIALFVSTGVNTQRIPDIADGQLTPADGLVTRRTEYDRNSRPTFQIEDDLDASRLDYDGVGRTIESTDPEGNSVEYAYDAADNPIETRETDVAQVAGVPNEIFLTTMFYDSLDRLSRQVDNLGQTTDHRYDSRDNRVASSDAQGPVTGATVLRRVFPNGASTVNAINGFGNVSITTYDGINRVIRTDQILTASGVGSGVSPGADVFGVKLSDNALTTALKRDFGQSGDGRISILYDWDGNSLQTSLTDDSGNRTDYSYDNLDRVLSTTRGTCDFASALGASAAGCGELNSVPTTETVTYDLDNNITAATDENGSVRRCTYDALNRPTSCAITRSTSAGVIGTTALGYEYDGLSRLTRATDNNDPTDASDDSVIINSWDSLSRVIEESQKIGLTSAKVVSSGWQAENMRVTRVYPNGRTVEVTFDGLDRIDTIADQGVGQSIADYDYIGPYRELQRTNEINGTRETYLDATGSVDVGYDGLRRPVMLRNLRTDQSLIVGFEHTWDRMNNKNVEVKLHDSTNSEVYDYDSAYRLIDFQRGTLNAGRTAIITPSVNSRQQQAWNLDGPGNWAEHTITEAGVSTLEIRDHSSFNEIYVIQDDNTSIATDRSHDDNGNLTSQDTFGFSAETLDFEWDHANRLRRVSLASNGTEIAKYAYDALGRRTLRVVSNTASFNGTTRYYYDNWQVVEERDGADQLARQYVYGASIDEPLVLDRNLGGGATATGSGDERLVYHRNTLGSIFALTDSTGVIVEGYQYDAYGEQIVFSPGPNATVDFGGDDVLTSGGASGLGNPYMFTGRRFDPESGQYQYRTRYMDPATGRFTSRDSIGTKGGINVYAYVNGNPANYSDPMGLIARCCNTRSPLYLAMGYPGLMACASDFAKEHTVQVPARIVAKYPTPTFALGLGGLGLAVIPGGTAAAGAVAAGLAGPLALATLAVETGLWVGGLWVCDMDVCTSFGYGTKDCCPPPYTAISYPKWDKAVAKALDDLESGKIDSDGKPIVPPTSEPDTRPGPSGSGGSSGLGSPSNPGSPR